MMHFPVVSNCNDNDVFEKSTSSSPFLLSSLYATSLGNFFDEIPFLEYGFATSPSHTALLGPFLCQLCSYLPEICLEFDKKAHLAVSTPPIHPSPSPFNDYRPFVRRYAFLSTSPSVRGSRTPAAASPRPTATASPLLYVQTAIAAAASLAGQFSRWLLLSFPEDGLWKGQAACQPAETLLLEVESLFLQWIHAFEHTYSPPFSPSPPEKPSLLFPPENALWTYRLAVLLGVYQSEALPFAFYSTKPSYTLVSSLLSFVGCINSLKSSAGGGAFTGVEIEGGLALRLQKIFLSLLKKICLNHPELWERYAGEDAALAVKKDAGWLLEMKFSYLKTLNHPSISSCFQLAFFTFHDALTQRVSPTILSRGIFHLFSVCWFHFKDDGRRLCIAMGGALFEYIFTTYILIESTLYFSSFEAMKNFIDALFVEPLPFAQPEEAITKIRNTLGFAFLEGAVRTLRNPLEQHETLPLLLYSLNKGCLHLLQLWLALSEHGLFQTVHTLERAACLAQTCLPQGVYRQLLRVTRQCIIAMCNTFFHRPLEASKPTAELQQRFFNLPHYIPYFTAILRGLSKSCRDSPPPSTETATESAFFFSLVEVMLALYRCIYLLRRKSFQEVSDERFATLWFLLLNFIVEELTLWFCALPGGALAWLPLGVYCQLFCWHMGKNEYFLYLKKKNISFEERYFFPPFGNTKAALAIDEKFEFSLCFCKNSNENCSFKPLLYYLYQMKLFPLFRKNAINIDEFEIEFDETKEIFLTQNIHVQEAFFEVWDSVLKASIYARKKEVFNGCSSLKSLLAMTANISPPLLLMNSKIAARMEITQKTVRLDDLLHYVRTLRFYKSFGESIEIEDLWHLLIIYQLEKRRAKYYFNCSIFSYLSSPLCLQSLASRRRIELLVETVLKAPFREKKKKKEKRKHFLTALQRTSYFYVSAASFALAYITNANEWIQEKAMEFIDKIIFQFPKLFCYKQPLFLLLEGIKLWRTTRLTEAASVSPPTKKIFSLAFEGIWKGYKYHKLAVLKHLIAFSIQELFKEGLFEFASFAATPLTPVRSFTAPPPSEAALSGLRSLLCISEMLGYSAKVSEFKPLEEMLFARLFYSVESEAKARRSPEAFFSPFASFPADTSVATPLKVLHVWTQTMGALCLLDACMEPLCHALPLLNDIVSQWLRGSFTLAIASSTLPRSHCASLAGSLKQDSFLETQFSLLRAWFLPGEEASPLLPSRSAPRFVAPTSLASTPPSTSLLPSTSLDSTPPSTSPTPSTATTSLRLPPPPATALERVSMKKKTTATSPPIGLPLAKEAHGATAPVPGIPPSARRGLKEGWTPPWLTDLKQAMAQLLQPGRTDQTAPAMERFTQLMWFLALCWTPLYIQGSDTYHKEPPEAVAQLRSLFLYGCITLPLQRHSLPALTHMLPLWKWMMLLTTAHRRRPSVRFWEPVASLHAATCLQQTDLYYLQTFHEAWVDAFLRMAVQAFSLSAVAALQDVCFSREPPQPLDCYTSLKTFQDFMLPPHGETASSLSPSLLSTPLTSALPTPPAPSPDRAVYQACEQVLSTVLRFVSDQLGLSLVNEDTAALLLLSRSFALPLSIVGARYGAFATAFLPTSELSSQPSVFGASASVVACTNLFALTENALRLCNFEREEMHRLMQRERGKRVQRILFFNFFDANPFLLLPVFEKCARPTTLRKLMKAPTAFFVRPTTVALASVSQLWRGKGQSPRFLPRGHKKAEKPATGSSSPVSDRFFGRRGGVPVSFLGNEGCSFPSCPADSNKLPLSLEGGGEGLPALSNSQSTAFPSQNPPPLAHTPSSASLGSYRSDGSPLLPLLTKNERFWRVTFTAYPPRLRRVAWPSAPPGPPGERVRMLPSHAYLLQWTFAGLIQYFSCPPQPFEDWKCAQCYGWYAHVDTLYGEPKATPEMRAFYTRKRVSEGPFPDPPTLCDCLYRHRTLLLEMHTTLLLLRAMFLYWKKQHPGPSAAAAVGLPLSPLKHFVQRFKRWNTKVQKKPPPGKKSTPLSPTTSVMAYATSSPCFVPAFTPLHAPWNAKRTPCCQCWQDFQIPLALIVELMADQLDRIHVWYFQSTAFMGVSPSPSSVWDVRCFAYCHGPQEVSPYIEAVVMDIQRMVHAWLQPSRKGKRRDALPLFGMVYPVLLSQAKTRLHLDSSTYRLQNMVSAFFKLPQSDLVTHYLRYPAGFTDFLEIILSLNFRTDLINPAEFHMLSTSPGHSIPMHLWIYIWKLPLQVILSLLWPRPQHTICMRMAACRALCQQPPDVWRIYSMQMIQALRTDPGRCIEATLLYMSGRSLQFAHDLFFALSAQTRPNSTDKLSMKCSSLREYILESMDTLQRNTLLHQYSFFDKLCTLSGDCLLQPPNERKNFLTEKLRALYNSERMHGLYLPTKPSRCIINMDFNNFVVLRSAAKAPFLVHFLTSPLPVAFLQEEFPESVTTPSWKEFIQNYPSLQLKVDSCIFKLHDDIRQDQLTLQIIDYCRMIFDRFDLGLWLHSYRVISHRASGEGETKGSLGGIIECIPNSISFHQIFSSYKGGLLEYFSETFGPPFSDAFEVAVSNFTRSLAGYSVVSFLLQIKDRNNGNIMLLDSGHIVHIDYGFVFDISPAKDIAVERAPFKLTHEMVELMGGRQSHYFQLFMHLCVKGFLALRDHADHILHMVELMTHSGLPCFKPLSMQRLRERFRLGKNIKEASRYMENKILQSYNSRFTLAYDFFQKKLNGIEY